MFIGGVHGKNQDKVFKELYDIVEETITIMLKEGRPLPKGNFNKKFSGKIALRITPELHKVLAVKAMQEGESINKYIAHNLAVAI